MDRGSWAAWQAALPIEARAGGEPDDWDEADAGPPVEIATFPCPACGQPVRAPVDAEGDDLCCGPACVAEVIHRMQADADRWHELERQEHEAQLVDGQCSGGCGKAVRDHPSNFQTGCAFCSRECGLRRAAELYGDAPEADVPF